MAQGKGRKQRVIVVPKHAWMSDEQSPCSVGLPIIVSVNSKGGTPPAFREDNGFLAHLTFTMRDCTENHSHNRNTTSQADAHLARVN